MAGKSAVLAIRIIADGKQAGREFAETNKQVAAFDDGMGKAAGGAAILAAGIGVLAYQAGQSASNLQQATGAIESVYGTHANEVKKMADAAAENVGLAESQYMELSSVIGSQLKNMGVPMNDLAGQTDDLVSLGADLAATFGGSTSDAVSALASLLRGERDPIERFGVSIKQADVNAQLAAMGMADLEGEAAKSAETQAVLALLTKQTADVTGQFARETDTAAGSQQIANAQYENAMAVLGERLLPIMAQFSTMLADVALWVAENSELVTALAVVLGTFAGAILIANGAISAYRTIAAIATAAQIAWNVAMSANPLGLIILAIAAVVAAIVFLITNWEEVGRIAGEVWDNIIAAIDTAIGWIKDAIGWIGSLFGAAGETPRTHRGSGNGGGGPEATPALMAMSASTVAPASSATSSGGGWDSWAATSAPRAGDNVTNNNVTVNGAVDVDSTARQLKGILGEHDKRTGGGGTTWR
ncbi:MULTISPECIES: hypothetical protein [unclassified Microbacterium]|uniref:hypothetical protein n=1 Tax=unclassified Microbacterium TaxID=2609290 RepID=UPI0034677EE2